MTPPTIAVIVVIGHATRFAHHVPMCYRQTQQFQETQPPVVLNVLFYGL